jgi:hypothetical protein
VARGDGQFRDVLVVDDQADPPGRAVAGAFAIGQKTLGVLQADPEIFIHDVPSGGDA